MWKLLFSWPEFGVFINGPTVEGLLNLAHFLKIAIVLSVLPHCEWRLSPAENVVCPEGWM